MNSSTTNNVSLTWVEIKLLFIFNIKTVNIHLPTLIYDKVAKLWQWQPVVGEPGLSNYP